MSSQPIPLGRFGFPLNVNQRVAPPNHFDRYLWEEQARWKWLASRGGIKNFCAGTRYHYPPWIKMPATGERFQQISSIALPTDDGLDHVVLSFIVPNGYDGVGLTLVNSYTGQGFAEGSGDLTWRIKLNLHYPKNLGAIPTQLGSLITPYPVNAGQLLLQSDQLVQYIVNRAVGSAGLNGGRIVCSIWGYYYPRGTYVP